ncbi:protein of unknown function [Candidatus Methylocalor cossyra]|uniref:Uncharacterized protein n=1 Tax=Candidatus Methylocalor cossyra TaxID=3108543 RepID=A0ABM9NFD5_9GAMM
MGAFRLSRGDGLPPGAMARPGLGDPRPDHDVIPLGRIHRGLGFAYDRRRDPGHKGIGLSPIARWGASRNGGLGDRPRTSGDDRRPSPLGLMTAVTDSP